MSLATARKKAQEYAEEGEGGGRWQNRRQMENLERSMREIRVDLESNRQQIFQAIESLSRFEQDQNRSKLNRLPQDIEDLRKEVKALRGQVTALEDFSHHAEEELAKTEKQSQTYEAELRRVMTTTHNDLCDVARLIQNELERLGHDVADMGESLGAETAKRAQLEQDLNKQIAELRRGLTQTADTEEEMIKKLSEKEKSHEEQAANERQRIEVSVLENRAKVEKLQQALSAFARKEELEQHVGGLDEKITTRFGAQAKEFHSRADDVMSRQPVR